MLTLTVAVSALIIALTQGNREGWDSRYILTLLTIAGVAGVAFVVIELLHPVPLVELRLFGSIPFVMAMIVLFLTTMTFRGSGPMISVLQQRLLHFEPLLVAWTQMLPNLVYGAMVLVVGRISDRVPCHVLVISGLLVYAAGFWGYAGLNEITTVAMIMPFLMIRFTAEAFIVSPNNLATLQALPENKVYMATALSGLLRSIANTMGTAVATVVLDQRYNYRLQQYAEDTPLDAFGYTGALGSLSQMLRWSGEVAAQIPTQTMALMQDRLVAEASTAAWKDYFVFNACLALLCLFPALPFWRREKYQAPAPSETEPTPVPRAVTSNGIPRTQASSHDNPTRAS
jgi:hypothetical protein